MQTEGRTITTKNDANTRCRLHRVRIYLFYVR